MFVVQEIILNIDVAPTIADLAGIKDQWRSVVDGESFKPLLLGNSTTSPTKWRTQFLVEHDGEHVSVIEGCPALNNQNVGVSLASTVFTCAVLC